MKTQIIADVGANHNGDMQLAKKMIHAAAESGADYVKFQSWRASKLVKLAGVSDEQFARDLEYYKKRELSDEQHKLLLKECEKNGVRFLTTCFDIERVDFLANLGIKEIKVPSPDSGSHKMISLLAKKFDHLIVSTGMSVPADVEKTAGIVKRAGKKLSFMHCVSLYPLAFEKANLARMNWLKRFTPSVGFSDHSVGTELGKIAIAWGASFLEKHFTIDRGLEGKDQRFSALPHELRELADYAKRVELAMGSGAPGMLEEEKSVRVRYVGKWGVNK